MTKAELQRRLFNCLSYHAFRKLLLRSQAKLLLFNQHMELIRAHVWISGRVQGVAYRITTAKIATHLGLMGWVRNLPDGRVEAVFEGEESAIEAMLRWCHDGPPEAIVEQVSASYETPEGLQSFNMRR